ncbi:TetR/AcrR family transcriptional regulator [Glycomyces buryatensis]|uniref:TetR/AcrR family transcriptional regulator n=1 Tax=Glycomyces buryatensis TaxID=2570927 RepID=A0A4S8Q9G4_9ACTN|nr:TetR/AcrR family transcriptional regulator [Glycomyces buryatensis]THV40870.1 TetR/AcrR family transcriptional regulator [Glycomyces buryatensis]
MTSTREAMVGAAAQLLDEGGVEAVTLRDVGRLVGLSHNAPYKHFAGKEALLAAVAARELQGLHSALSESPRAPLRTVLHDYIDWALRYPARFKLVFGPWTIDSDELAEAATLTQSSFLDLVATAQADGALPPGDTVRLASLLRALTHGAADLALAGHMNGEGKGNASPAELVDDLLGYLRDATAGK